MFVPVSASASLASPLALSQFMSKTPAGADGGVTGKSERAGLATAFEFRIGEPVLPNLVTIGRFDGVHAAVACATASDTVVVLSPETYNAEGKRGADLRRLHVSNALTSLASGRFSSSTAAGSSSPASSSTAAAAPAPPAEAERDVLFMGFGTHLQAFDLEKNQDVFYNQVAVCACDWVMASWLCAPLVPWTHTFLFCGF